ncbi:MAG: single-stranded-DNA-specific exonuclease RecJ, partial [Anaerolineales bacterium]
PPAFAQAIGGHPIVARTLYQRGFQDIDEAVAYIDADHYTPTSPFELPGASQAVEIILEGIEKQSQICVWGDFDVDGQTSTTTLVSGLRHFGAQVRHYIPVRGRESHGLHAEKLDELLSQGVELLVTCDTGVSDSEAVDLARNRGVPVVITDHHDLPSQLPAADAIMNPKLLPREHPLFPLPGVGVAYLLIQALADRQGDPDFVTQLLDLAALGIVADVAELRGEARYLLQKGLPVLRETPRVGLQTMMALAELNPASLTEEHIGFVLGPRLNALGRLADTNPIVDFLTTRDRLQARLFADQLEGLNARRQLLTDQVFQGALDLIEREPRCLNYEVLVLAHPAWPGGVVGIVASRLAERFARPVILLTAPEGQPARGSARSIEGVDITQAISQQADMLHSFGGHPMAAGLALDQERIDEFRQAISQSVAQQMVEVREPALTIDASVPLAQVDFEFVDAIERLAPFGSGNPAPVLAAREVRIENSRVIGRSEDHLILNLVDKQQKVHRVLWWNGAGLSRPEGEFDLAYTARRSNYRGQAQIQIEWLDWRQTAAPEPVDIQPEPALQVMDHRREADPQTHLSAIEDIETDVIVWREGRWVDEIKGVDRFGLRPASALVVWSMPASLELLNDAIQTVQPARLFLFAQQPGFASPVEFSKELAGLIKFALSQRGAQVSVARLAVKTGHEQLTVEAGLRWLASRGHITIESAEQDTWKIRLGGKPNGEAEKWGRVLEDRLQETLAFRQHYLRVEYGFLLVH